MSTTQLRVAFRYFKIGTFFFLKWSSLLRHPHFVCKITQMYKAGLAEDCITNLLIAYEWQNLYHLYLKVNTDQKLQNRCPQIAKCDFKTGSVNGPLERDWSTSKRCLLTFTSSTLDDVIVDGLELVSGESYFNFFTKSSFLRFPIFEKSLVST